MAETHPNFFEDSVVGVAEEGWCREEVLRWAITVVYEEECPKVTRVQHWTWQKRYSNGGGTPLGNFKSIEVSNTC